MLAKAVMAKPLPTRRRASRRVSGLADLCDMVPPLVDEHELARTEQNLDIAAPSSRVVLHFRWTSGTIAAPAHPAHHSHAHRGWHLAGRHVGGGFRACGCTSAAAAPTTLGGLVLGFFVLLQRLFVQIGNRELDLVFPGIAAVDQLVGLAHSGAIVGLGSDALC